MVLAIRCVLFCTKYNHEILKKWVKNGTIFPKFQPTKSEFKLRKPLKGVTFCQFYIYFLDNLDIFFIDNLNVLYFPMSKYDFL